MEEGPEYFVREDCELVLLRYGDDGIDGCRREYSTCWIARIARCTVNL
jgi:hypothetical protein